VRLDRRDLNVVSASTVLVFAVLGCFVVYAPCLPSFVQGFQLMTLRKRLN
jgi:hypothetical protein